MSVEITRLANGLVVATDAMPEIGTAAVSATFGAGSRSEREREHGLAHLLEHMAFKGTNRRTALDIAREIEEVGGDLNAATGVEQTSYEARVLKDDVPLAIDILADIVTDPLFDEEELGREKGVILQEIGAVEDTPDDLVHDMALEIAYRGQSLGRAILGTPQTVKALDRDAITAFRGAHYTAGRGVVAAAGAVDHSAFVRDVEASFGALPAQGAPPPPEALWTGGEVRDTRDLEQAHLVFALPGRSILDDETYALQVFANVLGGGMSSRLFQEVREKRGLVYSIHAFHWAFHDTGLFGIYAGTGEDDLDELMPVMLGELARTAETIDEREVQRAKAQMRMSLELAREQATTRCERLSRQMLAFGRPISPAEILEHLESVTVEDVRRTAAQALSGKPALAAIGPVSRIPDLGRLSARIGADARAA